MMQRLHTDDLVGNVQRLETWEVLSLPAIAEEEKTFCFATAYGKRTVHRLVGDILNPALLSNPVLDNLRRSMTEYNFTAQYQQNPQPHAGVIVKREWLRFYDWRERPSRFDTVLQSWDTASKVTELSDYSVCTTWGLSDGKVYLLDVFRRRLEFPALKYQVIEQANFHRATVVLIEDSSSGTQLIQQLHAEGYSIVQAAPSLEGDKVMRLRSQTPKIESGFARFPVEADWLDRYLSELLGFPNTTHADQVDSTVFALAWAMNNTPSSWTDERLENLGKATEMIAFAKLFGGI